MRSSSAARVLSRRDGLLSLSPFLPAAPSTSAPFSTAGGDGAVIALDAVTRSSSGSRAAAKLRSQGLVPGVVFSMKDTDRGDKLLLAFDKKTIASIHQKVGSYGFACQVFDIRVNEKRDAEDASASSASSASSTTTHRVLGRQIHSTAATAEPENVTFIDFHPSRKVKVDVPLRTFGKEASPGIRAGGRVNWIRRTVPCLVDASAAHAVPACFEVDISELEVNDKVLWTALEMPAGVEVLLKDPRQPLLKMARK